MKSIGIVTNSNSKVSSFLRKNLDLIFKGFLEINNYFINEFEDDFIIKDELVLFMTKEITLEHEKHVLNKKSIIFIERTLKINRLYKILTLPKNTKVLVVNDTWETTLETVALLYQVGINNLILVPFKPNQSYENINIAITPGEKKYVPNFISTVINIGNRLIDTSTFIKIINKLDISNKIIEKRLIKYSEDIINLNEGIKNSYKELFIKKEELNIITRLSKDGILFIDKDQNIVFYNDAFKDIFNLKNKELQDKKLEYILHEEVLKVFKKSIIKNEVINVNSKYININKQEIKSLDQSIGFYFNLQEITYIKQLEENLSKKLATKGLVAKYNFTHIKTNSSKMKNCIKLAKKISNSNLTVLIIGESGTGKELLAQSIHNSSDRANQPFVAVNCAALPKNLLESELFGYEGGSFTGALKDGKIGLFEQAHNGSIFLDEIGDMPLSLQARMLRVLQERQVMRIGSSSVIDINVRIIAATNKNLIKMVEQSTFREDLFYRLNVLPIHLPPLRVRRNDIILLLKSFIKKNLRLSEKVTDLLINYNWPGNIRELQNVASYIDLMCTDNVNLTDLPHYIINCDYTFSNELTLIQSKFNILIVTEIMEVISEKISSNSRIGRRNIKEILNNKGIVTTESEIRRILLLLNELGLVVSNLGRRGSELTSKGKNFIQCIDNN